MTSIVPELQKIAPSAIIELFKLELVQALHGSTEVYRFHAGANAKAGWGAVVWNAEIYDRYPIEVEGFEYSGGQLPRPKLRISNALGLISAVLAEINTFNRGSDLTGAKLTRIRTCARYLDAVNFSGDVNPFGTPDPTAEAPREIYYVDRKTLESRDVVEFELAAAFDLAGVRAPKRQCIANICQWQYKSGECGYSPVATFTGTYSRKQLSGTYSRSGTTITVTSSGHGISAGEIVYLDFTSGAGLDAYYTVDSASSNSFTVTSNASDSTSGNCTVYWMRVDAAGHGLIVADTIYLDFTSGGATPAVFTVGSAQTNSFTVLVLSGTTASGNLRATQWYDATDAPVYQLAQDVCGKRLSSCERRFDPGNDAGVPFGSFPSVGTYYG